jgi:hypothetical protein
MKRRRLLSKRNMAIIGAIVIILALIISIPPW